MNCREIAELLRVFNEKHPHFRIECGSGEAGDSVIFLSGELDLQNSHDLEPILEGIINSIAPRGILSIDMKDVGYVSSSGVGFLVNMLVKARKRSVRLALVNMQPKVKSVFELLGFFSYFDSDES